MKTLTYIIIAACLMMASCQPDPDPVHFEVTGTGSIAIGYCIDNTWTKYTITDHWEMDTEAYPGDTIQLSAYGNGMPVEISINELSITVPGDGYGNIVYE